MSKQKILMLYPDMKPGGAVKLMVQMANVLNRNGFAVCICAGEGSFSSMLDQEIKQFGCDLNRERGLAIKLRTYIKTYFLLQRIVRENEINLIINHHRYFAPLLFLLRKRLKIQVIFNAAATFKKIPLLRGSIFGDKVIAVSRGVKEHLMNNFRVSESVISVIYNGIEPVNLKSEKAKEKLKNELGIKTDKVVSCIGNFRDLKRQDFLLRAWRMLINEHQDSHLILLGYGETEQKLKNYVRENAMGESVSILVDSHEPEEIYNISKVFVLPSEREGLPLTILEASSLKIPTIGTNTSGINEVIDDRVNGLLFDMEDIERLKEAMISLLYDQQLNSRIGNAAHAKFVERFSIEKYSQAILEYLN